MRHGIGSAGMLAILVTIGIASPGDAMAQRTPPPPRGEMDALDAPPTPEEIREAMDQLMIVRMKKTVQLTPQQEERVVPKVQQLLEARRQHAARRREEMGRLIRLVRDEAASEESIGRALKDLATLQQESRRREDDLRAAINADLAPRQQARLMVFEARFRRLMQRRLQEAAGRRAGGPPEMGGAGRRMPGPGGPGGPPEADPEDLIDDELEGDL